VRCDWPKLQSSSKRTRKVKPRLSVYLFILTKEGFLLDHFYK
jgi:hypothetical protein